MVGLNCALCGKKDFQVLYPESFSLKNITKKTFSARRIPEKVHYRIVRCRKCKQVFSNPIFEEKALEKLYKDSLFTYNDQEKDLKVTYGYYLKKAAEGLSSKENYLDIGCGNGFMLEVAKGIGFKNVYGVEPSLDSTTKAKKDFQGKIKGVMFKDGLYPDNYFDLITVFQTLDHITNPNIFLKNIFKILRPGGKVLSYNHNVSSLSAKFLGEKSPIIDIEHIYLFDKTTMREIFENNGFKVVGVESTFNIYPLSYWLRMFPFINIVKKLLLTVASFLRIDNIRLKLYAGNLGLIASK